MTAKKDKSGCVVISQEKGRVSWIQKQYDENDRLYAYDFFMPNCTMVSLGLVDSLEWFNIMGSEWSDEKAEIMAEIERLKEESEEE